MSNTKESQVCGSCNGFGHDKASRPIVKFEPEDTPKGRRLRHITIKQGSGCITCGGTGKK